MHAGSAIHKPGCFRKPIDMLSRIGVTTIMPLRYARRMVDAGASSGCLSGFGYAGGEYEPDHLPWR